MLSEALKTKLPNLMMLRREGKRVCAFIAVFNKDRKCALLEDMRSKYFRNLADEDFVRFVDFDHLRQEFAPERQTNAMELTQKSFEAYAKSDINAIIRGLSKSYAHSILLIDEVPTCSLIPLIDRGSASVKSTKLVKQDWSDLLAVSNVEWMIGISPGGYENTAGGDFFKLEPPSHPNILPLQLRRRYRNCPEIRQFHTWYLEHYTYAYMTLARSL